MWRRYPLTTYRDAPLSGALQCAVALTLKDNMETLQSRYDIYVACAESLGWEIKTFEEWVNS